MKSNISKLTNREKEVLELLAKAYTDKEIADTLIIATITAKSHVRSIYTKLGLRKYKSGKALRVSAILEYFKYLYDKEFYKMEKLLQDEREVNENNDEVLE